MKYKIYNDNIYISRNIRILICLKPYSQCYIADAAMNEKMFIKAVSIKYERCQFKEFNLDIKLFLKRKL